LLNRGRPHEAAQALRAAAAGVDPASAERRMDLVRALIIEKKDAEAEAEVRRALKADPKNADGHWLLGRILSDAGRFDEARAAFEASLALKSRQGAVYYDLVRCFRLVEADRPLVARMLALARTEDRGEAAVRLQFALGKALDDLGDYAAAMRHFHKGNQLKARMVAFDRTGLAQRIDRLIAQFTPDWMASNARAQGGERAVFVVGLPRSGTTLVEQILASHPDVEGAGELQFWAGRSQAFERLAQGPQVSAFLDETARDHREMLAGLAPDASRVVDKNPFNFLSVGLIRLVLPQAVVIHCRRNPIDTCLSIHSTYFGPRPDFATGLEDLAFYHRQYARLMDHWRAALPADRFVELDYETLVTDPEPQVRRLLAACGLSWDEACLHPERTARAVRTPSRWQARQPITPSSVGRWRTYEPWIQALL
jgi:tetratricopeptide (TPR) repeat protein